MRKLILLILTVTLGIFSAFVFTGCQGEDPTTPTPEPAPDTRLLPCNVCETGEYTVSTTPATKTEDGASVYTCGSCGDSYTEVIPATHAFKILVIGDASSSSSITDLPALLSQLDGIENVIIGTLNMGSKYSSGVALSHHAQNISQNKGTYTYAYMKNGTIEFTEYSKTLEYGLENDDWDVIVIQQYIGAAGLTDSYSYLGEVIDYIYDRKPTADTKILWNMVWAFDKNTGKSDFDDYDRDQSKMYGMIADATENIVKANPKIDAIIPTATAVQNARETELVAGVTGTDLAITESTGKFLVSLTYASVISGLSESSFTTPSSSSITEQSESLIRRSVASAIAKPFELEVPELKIMKVLFFGNSYSNDAITYLTKIFLSAGYDQIIIGSISTGGCNINHHWSNLDPDLEDFHPGQPDATNMEGTASCSIKVNGSGYSVKGDTLVDRYANTVKAYDWDYISIQHAPNEVEQLATYSYLPNLVQFIEDNLIDKEKTKLVYHMIWKYNDTQSEAKRTSTNYNTIVDITQNFVLQNEEFGDRVVPAATFRQNMVSSFLEDVDIARDYGHMGLTLGRYALGLLWYCYLTGGSVDDVTYIPVPEDVDLADRTQYKAQYGHTHLTITEDDMLVIKEAIENALNNPYQVTQSQYTTAPSAK